VGYIHLYLLILFDVREGKEIKTIEGWQVNPSIRIRLVKACWVGIAVKKAKMIRTIHHFYTVTFNHFSLFEDDCIPAKVDTTAYLVVEQLSPIYKTHVKTSLSLRVCLCLSVLPHALV